MFQSKQISSKDKEGLTDAQIVAMEWSLNILDIIAITIAIIALIITSYLMVHTAGNKEHNENALAELTDIKKLLIEINSKIPNTNGIESIPLPSLPCDS